jgi:hypothetical protein
VKKKKKNFPYLKNLSNFIILLIIKFFFFFFYRTNNKFIKCLKNSKIIRNKKNLNKMIKISNKIKFKILFLIQTITVLKINLFSIKTIKKIKKI